MAKKILVPNPQTSSTAGAPSAPTAPSNTTKNISQKDEWFNVAKSLGAATAVYLICFYALKYFGVDFFFCAALGYIFGLLVFSYVGSVLTTPSELTRPIVKLMTLFLLFILAIHYLPGVNFNSTENKKPEIVEVKTASESFSFSGSERWATEVTFSPGKAYTVTVSGSPINMVYGGEYVVLTAENSPYSFTANSKCSPTFDGMSYTKGARSNVKVEWSE